MPDGEDQSDEDELEKLVDAFDQNATYDNTNDRNEKTDSIGDEDDADNDKISKEEIDERFDVKFAKNSSQAETQHLVRSGEDGAICRTSLSADAIIADSPGPFDPICMRCRNRILGKKLQSGSRQMTRADLRDWLADEIEGVKEADDNAEFFNKSEMAAVVEHIKQLKKDSQ